MDREEKHGKKTVSDWEKQERLVLYRLDEQSKEIAQLRSEVGTQLAEVLKNQAHHDKRIDRIHYKSGFFGTLGGIFGFVGLVSIEWFKGLLTK
jgi:uncharacterized small protein (DUF1192 family)